MTFNLLSQLMNQKSETSAAAKEAKNDLVENPEVVLEGVNAPEFEDSVPFDMEEQFASQPVTAITIPQHDDGLDDDEPELTPSHSEATTVMNFDDTPDAEEIPVTATTLVNDAEPDAWNQKPFNSRYFNFGGRTVNSLTRAGYTCFDDIKGFAYSELKAIKGFGQGCLDEVLELLEAENASDWLAKRKSRKSQSTEDLSVSEDSVSTVEEAVAAEPAEVAAEPAEEPAEAAAEPAEESVTSVEEHVLEVAPIASRPAATEPVQESGGVAQAAPSAASAKILVIGGQAYPMSGDLRVASFEQVYRDAIHMICQQANSPSLASIEFGKGWGALSATIRNNGWAQGVDVLTISSCYMSRAEILMELRLLADLVIESA